MIENKWDIICVKILPTPTEVLQKILDIRLDIRC